MPLDPILGIGTKVSVNRGAGFVDIAKLVEIGAFGLAGADVEVTNHDSVGGVKEYIRGLTDPSEITFKGVWIADPTQIAMMDDVLTGMAQPNLPYRITLAQNRGVFDFEGYLKEFTVNPQLEGRMECDGRFKMAGIPTFAVTESAGLTNLTVSVGTLVPAFSTGQSEYVDEVVDGTASITVTPTGTGTLTVNGVAVATGVASGAITTPVGLTDITVEQLNAGDVPMTYTITVARHA